MPSHSGHQVIVVPSVTVIILSMEALEQSSTKTVVYETDGAAVVACAETRETANAAMAAAALLVFIIAKVWLL